MIILVNSAEISPRLNKMLAYENRRVLIIDDNCSIHDDFRKILCPRNPEASALNAIETAIFGQAPDGGEQTRFMVDSAYQGQEGMMAVKRNLEAGLPFALAFVDMRMPPGWDGIETSARLWRVDPDLQIVICTAYTDSWQGIEAELRHTDRLLILKKPFEAVEILQLANALTEKWRLHQQLKQQFQQLERLVQERTSVLEETNAKLTLALANVQTLRGLIPICAGCKKIRDDRGFWSQVETYIAKHSDATFTHGICPECSRKYYPELEYPEQAAS